MLNLNEKTFCAKQFHKLEFKNESYGEVLWECSQCPYFEFAYKDCEGA